MFVFRVVRLCPPIVDSLSCTIVSMDLNQFEISQTNERIWTQQQLITLIFIFSIQPASIPFDFMIHLLGTSNFSINLQIDNLNRGWNIL